MKIFLKNNEDRAYRDMFLPEACDGPGPCEQPLEQSAERTLHQIYQCLPIV